MTKLLKSSFQILTSSSSSIRWVLSIDFRSLVWSKVKLVIVDIQSSIDFTQLINIFFFEFSNIGGGIQTSDFLVKTKYLCQLNYVQLSHNIVRSNLFLIEIKIFLRNGKSMITSQTELYWHKLLVKLCLICNFFKKKLVVL